MDLAGDFTVINDELVDALLSILRSGAQSETLRGNAAISLGPVLEHADTQGFEDADEVPITERTFHTIQQSLRTLYTDAGVPREVWRQILEALDSQSADVHYEAVCAAGNWRVDAAWPHIAALVTSKRTDKPLLLAAIAAVVSIRPQEAPEILGDLTDSDDEDIAEAAYEAMAMVEGLSDEDGEDDDEILR